MNKFSVKFAWLWLAVALLVPAAHAQGTAAGSHAITNAAPSMALPAPRNPPIHGTVIAVDTNAMTLTIGHSVFSVGPKIKITKANQAVTLADIKVGDYAVVIYAKSTNGILHALNIRTGPHPPVKPRQPTTATPAAPAARN